MAAKRTRKPARKDDRRERTILAQLGREVLPPPVGGLPARYPAFLETIKARIRTAQIKACLSINRELSELYWGIGQEIVQRQREEGWGRSVVERLSRDLRAEFPSVGGFSPQNIWKMRAFYLAWTDEVGNLSRPVRELDGEDFYIDLLFYHLRLRCFIVIDLKARPFKPEFAGKMSFYLSAVDDLLRHPDDNRSIGLILCKRRKRTVAEYALRDLSQIGWRRSLRHQAGRILARATPREPAHHRTAGS